MSAHRLNIAALQTALAQERIGHTLEYHASVPSTMPLARRLAEDAGCPAGAVVFTDEQTAGRGRLSRRWEVPSGQGLLLTVMLKPPLLPRNPAQLPMAASLSLVQAVADVVPALADQVWLKWPNDLLLCIGAEPVGKVAGILIETAYAGGDLDYALVGMGVNVNQDGSAAPSIAAGHLPAVSLRQQLGREVDRTALAIALCRRLAGHIDALRKDGGEQCYRQWRQRLHTLGRRVTARMLADGVAVVGTAVDVDRHGNLVLADDAGVLHRFGAGDVTLQPLAAGSRSDVSEGRNR